MNHLLVAIDESKYCEEVLRHCAKCLCPKAKRSLISAPRSLRTDLSSSLRTDLPSPWHQITLLHGYSFVPVGTVPGRIPQTIRNADSLNEKIRSNAKERAMSFAMKAKNLLLKEGCCEPINILVVLGEPWKTTKQSLLDAIENMQPTIIACGSRGMGWMSRMMLGSVSDFLVHNAQCTVCVIKVDPKLVTNEQDKNRTSNSDK